jgi:cytochrome c
VRGSLQRSPNLKGLEMRKIMLVVATVAYAFLASAHAANDHGTADEAVAMVQKAISAMKANGRDKIIAEINSRKGQFIDRDLYVVIYDMNGKNLAHGANPKMVGKDLIEIKDVDGKAYMRERIELVKAKGKGWQDYKFVNPVSKAIEAKSMYVVKIDDLIFGCGIYK